MSGAPLSAIPALHSNPGAPITIYLDFDGDAARQWGTYNVPNLPAFDTDGDATSFSPAELADIRQIWTIAGEAYSVFDVDVTTVDPGNRNWNQTATAVVSGNGDWAGGPGGISYTGSFSAYAEAPISYIFDDRLGQDPNVIGRVVAHELGHTFGLNHQFSAAGDGWAATMGYSTAARYLWAASDTQDDIARMMSVSQLHLRADDHGATPAAATPFAGGEPAGLITSPADADWFSFHTSGGAVSFAAGVAEHGAMLDLKLELRDAGGNLIQTADTAGLGETLSANVAAGDYFVVVASHGNYGDRGQYALTGTVPDAGGGGSSTPAPTADAGGPYHVDEGATVALSAAGSTGTNLSYAWDLDGDGVYGETGPAATRGGEVGAAVSFDAAGLAGPINRTVGLRVTDAQGRTAAASAVVGVRDLPPVVTSGFTGSAREGAPLTISLGYGDVTPVNGWRIDWGDGTISTAGAAATAAGHVYADNGTYNVSALARTSAGDYPAAGLSLAVADVAPVLTLSGPAAADEGDLYALSFSAVDPGADTISQWRIDWGDGTTATLAGNAASASHRYADNGIYHPRATATNEDGSFTSPDKTVAVANVAPRLTVTPPAGQSQQGAPVTIGLAASDPGADTISQWLLDWGDGRTDTLPGGAAAASHTYASAAQYAVQVRATDEDGTWAADAVAVNVGITPPALAVTGEAAVDEGSAYRLGFAATGSNAASVSSWLVDWGDATAPQALAAPAAFADHRFADDGVYAVRVTAVSPAGSFAAPAKTVSVRNVAPAVTLTKSASPREGRPVTLGFTAVDPGADTISAWRVDWGDGESQVLPAGAASAAHVYANDGSFAGSVRAYDEDGPHGPFAFTIDVADVPPLVQAGGAAAARAGLPYRLDFFAADVPGDVVDHWQIDWGDGAVEQLTGDAATAVHRYAVVGDFAIRVFASDADGATGSADVAVAVAAAPAIRVSLPDAADEGAAIDLGLDAADLASAVTGWTVDWGDGGNDQLPAGATTLSHAFADNGLYEVSVSAQTAGEPVSVAQTIRVRNLPAVATLAAAPGAVAGAPTHLTLAATDAAGDLSAGLSYVLDWHDGTADHGSFDGQEFELDHTFAAAGRARYTLLVVDKDGGRTVVEGSLDVAAPAETVVPDENNLLLIRGTGGDDRIDVAMENALLVVRRDGRFVGSWAPGAVAGVRVVGGAGDDRLAVAADVGVPVRLEGGDGDDTLIGGGGNDTLLGMDGDDRLEGGDGDDVLDASAGDDTLVGGRGDDTLMGGRGNDLADYSANAADQPIDVTLDDLANDRDGLGGVDHLAPSIRYVRGGAGDDRIEALHGRTYLSGGAGNDTLIGGDGPDELVAGPGDDRLIGRGGNDLLWSRGFGGGGRDVLDAGDGDDAGLWADDAAFADTGALADNALAVPERRLFSEFDELA